MTGCVLHCVAFELSRLQTRGSLCQYQTPHSALIQLSRSHSICISMLLSTFSYKYTLPSLHPITPETTQGPGGASTTRLNVLKKAQYKRTYRNKHQNSKLLQLYYYYRDFPPKFLSFSIFIKLDFRVGLFV